MSKLFEQLINRLPVDVVDSLKKTKQDPKHHPEGPVYKHVELVFDEVYKLYPNNTDMWVAAIFHDLGKIDTTTIENINGQKIIHAVNHELKSIDYYVFFRHLYNDLIENENLIVYIISQHMRMHTYNSGVMTTKKRKILEKHKYFEYLKSFSHCDDTGKISRFKRLFKKIFFI